MASAAIELSVGAQECEVHLRWLREAEALLGPGAEGEALELQAVLRMQLEVTTFLQGQRADLRTGASPQVEAVAVEVLVRGGHTLAYRLMQQLRLPMLAIYSTALRQLQASEETGSTVIIAEVLCDMRQYMLLTDAEWRDVLHIVQDSGLHNCDEV